MLLINLLIGYMFIGMFVIFYKAGWEYGAIPERIMLVTTILPIYLFLLYKFLSTMVIPSLVAI